MAIAKHCVYKDTHSSSQGADGSNRAAERARKAADRGSVDAAKGGDPRICQAGEPRPAKGTKARGAWMAEGRECGRHEDQSRASPNGPPKFDRVVGGAGHQSTMRTDVPRPASRAEVDAGMQRGGKGWISRHHQGEAARPADAGEVAAKCHAVCSVIVAQNDAGEAAGQAAGGPARIRQPVGVGEEPERRNLGMKASDGRVRPGQQARVHVAIAVAWAARADVVACGRR